ncbi:MAG: hypothetical protein RIS35_3502 [Pseudomonadota bacterium]|jgi:soluble lytic murein transglycosylase
MKAKFLARLLLAIWLPAILGCSVEAAQAKRPAAPVMAPDEAFVQARQAALRGDREGFEQTAPRASDPLLGEYLDYWRLRLALGPRSTGQPVDAQVRAFLERNAGTLVADLMRRDWLMDLARRGEWSNFDVHYPQWILRDDVQLDCWAWFGGVQRGRPLPPAADRVLFQPRELGDGCARLVDALAADGSLTRDDLWRRVKLALEGNAPRTVRRLAALMDLPPAAIENALQRPSTALTRGALPEIAVIAATQLSRQDPQEAAERFDELPLPDAEERMFVASQIAANLMRRLSPQALEWTRRSLSASASDETWVWLARAALRSADWKTLHTVIERMSLSGRRDPAWVYWHARTHRALGRHAEADSALRSIAGQFHFYGQLAGEELGQLTTPPRRAAPPSEQELAVVSRNPGFARALRFYALGLRAEGNREWNYQLRGMDDRQLLAAAAWACERSVLDRCVNTAERTREEHDFTLRFVTPFIDRLEPVARERGLDPAWVYGLIRQESRFVMDARSSAGAQGLMQIIPPTAKWIARRLGIQDFRQEHLHDLSTNLSFGTYYLKSVLDDLEGSPLLASAGYNAGPGRPRNWRATLPEAVEGAVFAEIIPFTETRDYVKKVLSNATFYSALLTGEPQSLKARLGSVAPRPPQTTAQR